MRRPVLAVMCAVCFLFVAVMCQARKHASDSDDTTTATVSSKALPSDALLLANFDSGEKINALTGPFGAWEKDPNDASQKCTMSFVKPGYDGKGSAIKLVFSVDSPNPAYNGLWMKLQDKDISAYKKLVFWVKGEPSDTPPNNFKMELKNAKEVGHFYVTGITGEWTKIEIPLDKFDGLTSLQKMTELTVVFEDSNTVPKKGSLYFDEIYFAK